MAALTLFHVPQQRRIRNFREKSALSLNFTDEELRARYRFGKTSIEYISNLIGDALKRKTRRNHALSIEQQVMVTLRFLASGSFLQVIGDTLGLDKGTVSRTVKNTVDALCAKKDDLITWPNENETRRIKSDFYRYGKFPNVVGAVDGTHVRIQAPHIDEASFVNRKGYHSINVQAICDVDGRFTSVNSSWPGSCHDSHIFRTSQDSAMLQQADVSHIAGGHGCSRNYVPSHVCLHMENVGNWEEGVLLGDSGYPCRPFIMTPFLHPQEEAHIKYNKAHAKTRAVIERTFGRWKRRFHVLHSEIRMKPLRVSKIIMACAVLHNISIFLGEPLLDPDCEDQEDVPAQLHLPYNGPQDGRHIREHIVQSYFSH